MILLTTSRYNGQTGLYEPVLRVAIDPETQESIKAHFAGKPPAQGFYSHAVQDSASTETYYSACSDIVGLVNSKNN